jgi:hypothetical protein
VSGAVTTVAAGFQAGNMTVTAAADRVDTFRFMPAAAAATSASFLATPEWYGPSTAQCPAGTDCIVKVFKRVKENGFGAMDNTMRPRLRVQTLPVTDSTRCITVVRRRGAKDRNGSDA